MGAGCTKPLDNIVEVRNFDDGFEREVADDGDGQLQSKTRRARSISLNAVGDSGADSNTDCLTPARNRNHRGAFRVVMHIQEAENYASQNSAGPPLDPKQNASPRRNQNIVHDGSYKGIAFDGSSMIDNGQYDPLEGFRRQSGLTSSRRVLASSKGSVEEGGDIVGDDERSNVKSNEPLTNVLKGSSVPTNSFIVGPSSIAGFGSGRFLVAPQRTATDTSVGQSGTVKEDESLKLIMSREVSRRTRRSHLQRLPAFSSANEKMRREIRFPSERALVREGEKTNGSQCDIDLDTQSVLGGTTIPLSEGRYFGDGDETARTEATSRTKMSAASCSNPTQNSTRVMPQQLLLARFGGAGFDDASYYATFGATQNSFLGVRPMASAPASPDRASSAPADRSGAHSSAVPIRRDGNFVDESSAKRTHHHHHYKCHASKIKRLELRWRREAIDLYCPQLKTSKISQVPVSGGLLLSHEKDCIAIDRFEKDSALRLQHYLFDGEGYNSEVPSDFARDQWRRTRDYYQRVYKPTMLTLADQRLVQRQRRRSQLRNDHKKREKDNPGRSFRKSIREFYDRCDSSDSCSSYDEYDDFVVKDESSVPVIGQPSYRKPIWASDVGAGVLASQYDLLVRCDQRRHSAEASMRFAYTGTELAEDPLLEESEETAKHIDLVFPCTVPLRQYSMSKRVSSQAVKDVSQNEIPQNEFSQLKIDSISSPSWSSKSTSEDETDTFGAISGGKDTTVFLPGDNCVKAPATRQRTLVSARCSSHAGENPSSSSSDDNTARDDTCGVCCCSSCSCSEGQSSWGVGTDSEENNQTISPDNNNIQNVNSSFDQSSISQKQSTVSSFFSCLPNHLKETIEDYVFEKRRKCLQKRTALSNGGPSAFPPSKRAGSRRLHGSWMRFLRWSVFRRGAAMSCSLIGVLAAIERRRSIIANLCARRFNKVDNSHSKRAGDSYFSRFFKQRFLPLNTSSRVPFLENYQHRFFRIVSASELHRGIIHPFAVDPPLLLSCAKDLRGEALETPSLPTLVTVSSVEALLGGVSALATARTAANFDISPAISSRTAKSSTGANLINRPALSNTAPPASNPHVIALTQLLQELKQQQKSIIAQAKVSEVDPLSFSPNQFSSTQERDQMYASIVKTLSYLRTDSSQANPLNGGLAALNSLSNGVNPLFSATSGSVSAFFPPSLLTEETEKHINGILYRRYGLLMAGQCGQTMDFHRFVSVVAPSILRYKIVHTNTSFIKEARTLQETKAAERAKQAEAQQQAQKALQQQQEQQRLLLQQQQLLTQQGSQQTVNQPVYLQIQGGGIAVLAVGPDNTLLQPGLLPGVVLNSQAVLLMVMTNNEPQPMLCYVIVAPPSGIGNTTTSTIMHPQQVLQLQQQIQLQQQQQQMVLMQQQQQQGGVFTQQQQQMFYHLQQQQQQLALMMGMSSQQQHQQQMILNLGIPTAANALTKEASQTSSVVSNDPWQTPSFSTLMENTRLLPSILYLQSSDVLFGTTRTLRHCVSVPTRVCVVTNNERLGDTLSRSFVNGLSTLCESETFKNRETHFPFNSNQKLVNMPRWLGRYAFPNSHFSVKVENHLKSGYHHTINGHVPEETQYGGPPAICVDFGSQSDVIETATKQVQLRHRLHGFLSSSYFSNASVVSPFVSVSQTASCFGTVSPGNLGLSPRFGTASVSTSSSANSSHFSLACSQGLHEVLSAHCNTLEAQVIHPHSYMYTTRMGEMALRQWARRLYQYRALSGGTVNASMEAIALANIFCNQQENIIRKQLSRLSRSNSCEVVTLHPSLLRKRLSGDERRKRRSQMAREPLKRAGGTKPQVGQPIGVGEATKTKPQAASSSEKPLFSREAISVIVIQQGSWGLASDPLQLALQQRLAKTLLKTRHTMGGVGAHSKGFPQTEKEVFQSVFTDVPDAIVSSQHLSSETDPMMISAARKGALSSGNRLISDATHPNSSNRLSEFMAHCVADFTIHNEYLYKFSHIKSHSQSAPSASQAQPHSTSNPEVDVQLTIAKALLTGMRLGFTRTAEIIKLSVESTNDELAFSMNRYETLNKSDNSMPHTVGSQRYGISCGRSVHSCLGQSLKTKKRSHKKINRSPQPTALSLQLEARVALLQQQFRYIADRGIYSYGLLYRHSFTDYPSLMLSLLIKEGTLQLSTLHSACVTCGGSGTIFNSQAKERSLPAVSTPRSTPMNLASHVELGPTCLVIPGPLADSLLPALYHHPFTSPSTVSESAALQGLLSSFMQQLLGLTLCMPTGSPPPVAAVQPLNPLNVSSPIQPQLINETTLQRARFSNHALLSKAMSNLIGPSSPTSCSTIYIRDSKLFCATVGHHVSSMLFNISPLAQHVVQNALNIRQQFAKTLATQLQIIQQIPPASSSTAFLSQEFSNLEEELSEKDGAGQRASTVVNIQPLQAQLRAFLFKGTSLTTLVLGDDIRYRYQAAKATAAADYNSKLSSSIGQTSVANLSGRGTLPGVPPGSLVDINTYKTQQSVVPAGCSGQLFVPLSAVPDLSLSGRQQRVRSHNKSRQKRSGSTSSMASSTGSLASSLHSSASRQDSSHSERRGTVVGESTIGSSSATSGTSNFNGAFDKCSFGVSQQIPNRSALRVVNDLAGSSRQAASWLGVQLACNTFVNYQTHDCISPNLKLPLPATTPVGPSVCISTVEVASVFSQAPAPCVSSPPAFLSCNPPPPSAVLSGVGGGLPAIRGLPSQFSSGGNFGTTHVEGESAATSPVKGLNTSSAPLLTTVPDQATIFHRLPQLSDGLTVQPGNPNLPDPLFSNALATVSSVGNLAYTIQTTVHSKSSLSPNYVVFTGSTDTWMAIAPEEISMFLSMLCPPDWANHGASTNSFLSVMVAAKVDFGSADIRGPFSFDKRRSYMSYNFSSLGCRGTPVPTPWVPCALGASGVVSNQTFLATNGISVRQEECSIVNLPVPTMIPTLPHPSTVTPPSAHYTSYFLSQTYCDVFGPSDYVRAYLNISSAGLRALLDTMGSSSNLERGSVTAAQVNSIALQQQQLQQMGKAPVPVQFPSEAVCCPPSSSSYKVSAPDACTIVYEVLSLLDVFSNLTLNIHQANERVETKGPWSLLSVGDRLRAHHVFYSAKIILAHGDYYHSSADGECQGIDGTPRTENSWYWEELAEVESCISRLAHGVALSENGSERPCHVQIEFPQVPPPPPVHVRLYRRFREKQADLLYHQVLKPRIDAMKKAHESKVPMPPPSNPATAPTTSPSSLNGKSSTDSMFITSPSTQGGDDFRNTASILSEVIAEEAASLDRILLHYRLIKDVLRRRRCNRLKMRCKAFRDGESRTKETAASNHMLACEQPFEEYKLFVRSAAYEIPNRSSALSNQIPITVGSPTINSSSDANAEERANLDPSTNVDPLAAAAAALASAHTPIQTNSGGASSPSDSPISELTVHSTSLGLSYSHARHYVSQVLAFK